MTEYTIMTYITNNYMTLLLLASLTVLLIANRKMKVEGLHFIWLIMGIVFTLTLCEAFEDLCDLYRWNYRLLYIKTALSYWLYPLTAMLELYLIAPIKRKLLVAIPYIINFILVFLDIFDAHIIFLFEPNHSFHGGFQPTIPQLILCFYVVMLGVYSVIFISKRSFSKGCIVGFMVVSSLITVIGVKLGYSEHYAEAVAVAEILVYYFFLAAIGYTETQKKLYESRIELEQENIRLMTAQIQPHFIFNSLSTLQMLCYRDGKAAADLIVVFGNYLRANIDSLESDKPIPFRTELEHVDQFISIIRAGNKTKFDVTYDLQTENFSVPSLTIQPIVENAIKYGALTRNDGTGRVTVKTEDADDKIIITITDNGTGADLTDKQKEHNSIGIENAKKRLSVQCGGTLDVSFSESGSRSVITLPKASKKTEAAV